MASSLQVRVLVGSGVRYGGDGYASAGIPLETFVSDSQYMDRDQDFMLGDNFTAKDMQVPPSHSVGINT